MVGLIVSRKGAAANVVTVGVYGRRDEFACVAIAAYELGGEVKVRPARSWKTRTWPSQSGPAPMPMVGVATWRLMRVATSRECLRDESGDTGVVKRSGVGKQRVYGIRGLALDFIAAHAMHGLGSKSDVSDDWISAAMMRRMSGTRETPPSILTASHRFP